MWTTPWLGLVANAAVVALVISFWTNSGSLPWRFSRPVRHLGFGLLLGFGSVVTMSFSFHVQAGVLIDLRAVVVAMAGFFGGPLSALVASAIACAWRLYLGGPGTVPGLTGILLVTVAGVAGWRAVGQRPKSFRDMAIFSVAVAASHPAAALALPQSTLAAVLPIVVLVMTPVAFVSTLLASLAIAGELQRREAVRSNQLYRMVIDSLPECLNVKDADGRFLIANPATARQLKAGDAGSVVGRTDFDFFPADVARAFQADERKVLANGSASLIEQELVHHDGSRAGLSTLKAPLLDGDGKVVGLITHNRDITERRDLENALKESERRLSDATSNMADGLVMFDADLNLVFCNEQYRTMFPMTADLRVPGTPAALILQAMIARGEIAGVPIDAAGDWVKGATSRLREPGTVQFPLRDGRWIESRTRPTEDGTCFVVCSDITKAKEDEKILLDLNKRLAEMAQTDGLTGLLNRSAFDAVLREEVGRAGRGEGELGLVFVDVDRFKAYNDTYGHTAGDDCLRAVADCLRAVARRPSDRAARYGGEELALVLPSTPEDGAVALASELRNRIRALEIAHTGSEKGIVTVSIGVATTMGNGSGEIDPLHLVKRADEALYEAKAGGRDLVRPWQPAKPWLVRANGR